MITIETDNGDLKTNSDEKTDEISIKEELKQ